MENEFKDILAEFLLENNLTQTAFAQKLGIKQSQVSEWLKGKAKPGYYMLRLLTVTFNKSSDYWFGIEK